MRPKLSVVVPCYNEAHNLRLGALAQVAYFLETRSYSWEVIIVDDGSDDESRDLIGEFIRRKPRFSLLTNKHQGKAMSVISGIARARGDYILFTDLDQATPLTEVDKLLPWFKQGYEVVIGSRNTKREGAPFLRYLMARGFMLLREFILGLSGVSDTQCGFKAFSHKAARQIVKRLKLYGGYHAASGPSVTAGFDVELLYIAKKNGFQIKDVPVQWHYVESRRINPLKDSIEAIVDLLRIKLNSIQGKYG